MRRTTTKKRGVYAAMREKREAELLSLSKKLLLEDGFFSVTMGMIAQEAGISRQRLYAYYPNLDEIIYHIQIRDLEAFMTYINNEVSKDNSNSMGKVVNLVKSVFAYLKKHPNDFIFTNEFDSFFRKRKVKKSLRNSYAASFALSSYDSTLGSLLSVGQKDGEFRSDFDPKAAGLFWINTVQMLCVRIAVFQSNGENHSPEELASLQEYCLDSIVRFLKK